MENLKFYDALRAVPEKWTKKITGGRLSGMTDIKPQWRTEKMTELFGPCGIGWYYEETKREYKDAEGQTAVFVDINLFYRYEKIDPVTERVIGYEWSKPIHGTGGSMFVAKESKGPFVSDEAVKMALTDALSVAMKSLGMAADIYMGMSATGTKYDKPAEPQQPAKPKLDVDSENYTMALNAVTNGSFTVAKIKSKYELTPAAEKALTEAETGFKAQTK